MKKWLGYTLPIIAVLVLACGASLAQKKTEGSMDCRDWGGNDRLQNHCEIKEQTVPAGGTITVDAGQNGGVAVKAWDRNEVLVRTRLKSARDSMVHFGYELVRLSDGALLAEGETTHIVTDTQMKIAVLPDKYLSAFRAALRK